MRFRDGTYTLAVPSVTLALIVSEGPVSLNAWLLTLGKLTWIFPSTPSQWSDSKKYPPFKPNETPGEVVKMLNLVPEAGTPRAVPVPSMLVKLCENTPPRSEPTYNSAWLIGGPTRSPISAGTVSH